MPLLPRIPARAREITQEPLTVAPHLLGEPLASFRRRLFAFLVDLVLFGLVAGTLFAGLSAWSFKREDPELFARVRAGLQAEDPAAGRDQVAFDVLRLVDRRAPEVLPIDVVDALAAGDTAAFVAWFTLLPRLGRGRTPGKGLLGLRAVRLDGRPLGWWDAFGRAGGYSASAATAFLGFLGMIWDPNRQPLHDRVAGTVVLRERRGRPAPRSGDTGP